MMNNLNSICVLCGSSSGENPIYTETAYNLGKQLAEKNIKLVFGGANIGVMGAVAAGCRDNNGYIIGITPKLFEDILDISGFNELIITNTMDERKNKMLNLSDAFLTLPGGFGTLDELFEFITLNQLSYHKKPNAILNINNYFGFMIDFLNNAVKERFIHPQHFESLIIKDNLTDILKEFDNYTYPELGKFLSRLC